MTEIDPARQIALREPTSTETGFLERPRFVGDPAVFLRILYGVPMKDRLQMGFTRQELQWMADVWETVAIVSRGDETYLREKRRFQKLHDEVSAGLVERKTDVSITLLEYEDWLPRKDVARAIIMLESAEMRGLH